MGIDLQVISVIVGVFIGLGTLIAGCGFAYAQFKTGGDKAKDDLIDTLKETAAAEKAKAQGLAEEKTTLVDSHQKQLNELNNKIGELTGLYKAAEASKGEYLAILQGRDPGQQKFMEIVMKQIEIGQKTQPQVQAYMVETAKILSEIRDFMERLNANSQTSKNFIKEVEQATADNEGNLLRKKS